jgi:NAD(P)-dependent dehydrogenase (short-subunit alcohol dehydrogenase family)
MPKVWLVTGSASGLGRNIAEAVLASGDRLVATARDPRRPEDLVEKYGDQVRTAPHAGGAGCVRASRCRRE